MAHKFGWYSRNGKTENLIDCVITSRRLAGAIHYTRIYRSAVIDLKSADHHLVVSKVKLKLKFRKGKCLPGRYDVGRLQDENLRENFEEQLNATLKSLEFDNVEDEWNNFRQTVCEDADGVLGKEGRRAARNISVKASCLIDRRSDLYKKFLSDGSLTY